MAEERKVTTSNSGKSFALPPTTTCIATIHANMAMRHTTHSHCNNVEIPSHTSMPISARAIGITLVVVFAHLLLLRYFWTVPAPEQRLADGLRPLQVTHITVTESTKPAESMDLIPLKQTVNRNNAGAQTTADSSDVESAAADTSGIFHQRFRTSAPAASIGESSASAEKATSAATSPESAAPVANAARIPNSVKLKYQVVGIAGGNKYQTSSELDWRHNGESYEAIFHTQNAASGVQTLVSTGRVFAEGLAPQRFLDRATKQSILFEPEKGKIAISSKLFDATWQKGAQDQISALLQIGSILAAEPHKWRQGATMSIYKADSAGTTTLLLVIEAEESLTLPLGQLQTLKVAHHAMSESWPKLEVWYASSIGYLPVRIRVTQQNGDVVEQSLSESSNR